MALQFCDGFDSYSASSDLALKWSGSSAMTFLPTGGRFGLGAVQPGFSGTLSKTLLTSIALGGTINVGFWAKFQSFSPSSSTIVMKYQGSLLIGTLFINASGQVCYQNGNSLTILSGIVSVTDGNWHWIEIQVLFQTTTGTVAISVDGVSQGSVSGAATTNTAGLLPLTSISLNASNAGWTTQPIFDDIIIWTPSGGLAAFPLTPRRISQLNPNADSTPSQFTPSTAGSHYLMVNGTYTSGNFLSDTGSGNTDLVLCGTLPYVPTSINDVVLNVYGQNPGAGTRTFIPKIKSGATTDSRSAVTLSDGIYTLYQTEYAIDPNTSAAWTFAAVNAAAIGIGD